MRQARNRISHPVTAAVIAASVMVAVMLFGPFSSFADESLGIIVLGVDEDTAVSLGPEIEGTAKFESSEETTTLAPAHALLLTSKTKAAAPVKAKAPEAKKPAAPAPKKVAPKRVPANTWRTAKVSWYGPGFYGNTMAGGGELAPDSMVAAHRSLPFGTRVEFQYGGKTCVATVMDRGPYADGRTFDLGPGTAKYLGFSGVGYVKYRVLGK